MGTIHAIAQIATGRPWITYDAGCNGEPDYFREYYQGGVLRYMQGESLSVIKIDRKRKQVTLQNESNDFGYERFIIPKAQFDADFLVYE